MFNRIYFNFLSLFIVFGLIIVFAVYFINKEVLKKNINDVKYNFAESYYKIESYNLSKSINEAKSNINSIIENKEFKDRLNIESLNKIFYDFLLAKSEILQLRLLNPSGQETVRFQRYDETKNPIIIPPSKLQNKSNSDYFKNVINQKDKFYISNFDLNVENNKIEKPYQPTIRISKRINDIKGNAVGVIVLNLNMKKFIKLFKSFEKFDSYLIDKDGYFLLHPDTNKEWSNVLDKKFNIKGEQKDKYILNNILTNRDFNTNFIYSFSLESIFKNNQNLKIIYIPKDEYIESILKDSNYNLMFILIPFIIVIALFLAIYPTKIRMQLVKLNARNDENLKLVNEYVATSLTNSKGIILDVNNAFCRLTGYSKEELIGKSHSILKSGSLENSYYQELWKTISSGKKWSGELENIKKNGQVYWISLIIKPKYNKAKKEMEFLSIIRNITDKKLWERLAQTDSLTNLFNRNRINEELEKYLYNVKRYEEDVSIMLLDIDYFKQVNDKYGHNIGDAVLVDFSNIIKKSARKSDLVGRWGGEEFVIVSPETNKDEMKVLAQKINQSVAKFEFEKVGHKTVSIGYTQIKSTDNNIKEFIHRADEALYFAKANGRNRVESDESVSSKPSKEPLSYII